MPRSPVSVAVERKQQKYVSTSGENSHKSAHSTTEAINQKQQFPMTILK
jgi:hypothetical protein